MTHFFLQVQVPNRQSITVEVAGSFAGMDYRHFLEVRQIADRDPDVVTYVAGGPITLYADDGALLFESIRSSTEGNGVISSTVTGYLLPVGAGR